MYIYMVQFTGSGYHPEEAAEILTSDDHTGTMKDINRMAECSTLFNNANITCGQFLGQPILLAMAQKLSIKNYNEEVTRAKEIPFASENKVMEVIYQLGSTNVSFTKGALEKVLVKLDFTAV